LSEIDFPTKSFVCTFDKSVFRPYKSKVNYVPKKGVGAKDGRRPCPLATDPVRPPALMAERVLRTARSLPADPVFPNASLRGALR
jgi:hypothetical protein